jgi:hypothetical protein
VIYTSKGTLYRLFECPMARKSNVYTSDSVVRKLPVDIHLNGMTGSTTKHNMPSTVGHRRGQVNLINTRKVTNEDLEDSELGLNVNKRPEGTYFEAQNCSTPHLE